jgi:TorA maturation chaperone TorD
MDVGNADSKSYLAMNEGRRLTYAFLSRIYEKEMTEELLKELLKENSLILQFAGADNPGEKFLKGLEMLNKYLEGLRGRDLAQVRLELAVEYANLFLGVKGKPPHPSESVYRSAGHVMYQEERDEVLSTYLKAGVNKVNEFKEPEDHIALELAFMAELSREARDRLSDKDMKGFMESLVQQKDFLQKHLCLWVEDLAKYIEKSARIDFYVAIGDITARFVGLDEVLVSRTIESLSSQDGK